MTCAEFRKPFGLDQGLGLWVFGLLGSERVFSGFWEQGFIGLLSVFFGFGLECFGGLGFRAFGFRV